MKKNSNTEKEGQAKDRDDLLEHLLEDARQKAQKDPLFLTSLKKFNNLKKFERRRFVCMNFDTSLVSVHKDYEPEKDGIFIRSARHDRKIWFEKRKESFLFNPLFKELLAGSTDVRSNKQCLRQDCLLLIKTTEEVKIEMNVKEVLLFEDILERIIQRSDVFYYQTIIGFWGEVIFLGLIKTDGIIKVDAFNVADYKGSGKGCRMLSRDVPNLVY